MNEEEKEAIKELKHYVNITPHWKFKEYTFSELDYYIKTTLNYIDKLQKVIDLMAEHIYEHDISTTGLYEWRDNKQIKEYFYKKAEEEK